jgi:hypothetical protein
MAWFASANQTGQIVGPALGGVLYLLGPTTVYGVTIVLWGLGGFMLALMRVEPTPRSTEPFSLSSLLGGFRFVRGDRIILGTLSLDMFAVFLGGATALLPIFARDIFGTGPMGLGLLQMSPAVGALLMSIPLSRWPMRGRVGPTLFAAVACFGCATILFGLSHSFVLTMMALAAYGAADMVSVVIRDTLIQVGTPDLMRGRVSAVHSLFIGTSNQLGQFRAGLTADWFGAVAAVVIGGVATLVVVVTGLKVFPELAGIKSVEGISKSAPPEQSPPSEPL